MPSYSLSYSLLETDGVNPAPAWISQTMGTTDTITIDHTTAVAGSYTYMLKAEIIDDLGTATGKYEFVNFNVDVY